MVQSYQNPISISTILNPNRILIQDSKMVQYDTKMYLNYILNIFLNIKVFFISLFNLFRICMYSKVNLYYFYGGLNGLISCDPYEHSIRISLCQVSGGQNVTIPTQFLLREHIYYCESYNSRLDYVRESRLDFIKSLTSRLDFVIIII